MDGAQQLRLGHEHKAKAGEQQDAQPRGPCAERALFRDRHDEAELGGEAHPKGQQPDSPFHADDRHDGIVRVHVDDVQAHLGTLLVRRWATEHRCAASNRCPRRAPALGRRPHVQRYDALGGVHVLSQQVQQRLAEPLGDVGRGARPKAKPPLGDEEETFARRARRGDLVGVDEHDSKFPPVLRRDGKLVEIVLRVVAEDVEGFLEAAGGSEQDRQVAHHRRQRGLDLPRPPRRHAPLERVSELPLLHVLQPRRVVPEFVPGRHVPDARSLVDREREQAAAVGGGPPRPTAFRGAPVARFQFARRRALPVQVDGPEGQMVKEAVPPQCLQAIEFASD